MAICNHLAPNGEKSNLYQQLEQKYGDKAAHDYWSAIRTEQFKASHPWEFKDEHGEPNLQWVEKNLGLNKSTFQPANQEQVDSIKGIQDFIQNGDPSSYFTLEGKAGTGKTTIVQEAIAPFIKQGDEVLITALSHKAKLVLQNKLEQRFGKDSIESASVAGALGMNMDLETGKFSTEFSQSYTPPPISTAKVIIVDEASMINEEALQNIMAFKRGDAKVIFLGDIGQLPPIRENKLLQGPSPVFAGAKSKARLLERVRQGEESPILPYADKYWDNSQSKSPTLNPAPGERPDQVSTKGALVFSKTINEIMDQILPQYKKAIETNNPDLIKTVVYKNDTRKAINNAVRRYIFGKEVANEKQVVPGELMMFQDNFTPPGKKDPISNATEVQIKHAEPGENQKYGYKVWKLQFIDDSGRPTQVEMLDHEETLRHNSDVSALFSTAKAMPKGSMRTAKLKEAWSLKRAFAPLDYSYAITSHKSQGSTYDTVVVHEGDIMSVGPTTAKEKSQSIYTALTRAKTATIVVDNQRPAVKENIQSAIDLSNQKKEAPSVLPTISPVIDTKEEQNSKKDEPGEVSLPTPVSTKQPPIQAPPTEIISKNFEPAPGEPYVSEDLMTQNIKALYDEAKLNPNKQYHIDYEFKSDRFRYQSGYTAKELANLLDSSDIPSNVKFSESFQRLINNSSRRILESLGESKPVEAINRNEDIINSQIDKILLTKRDASGKIVGFFTAAQHQDIIDSAMYATHAFMQRDPAFGANAIIKVFKGFEAYAGRQPGTDWSYIHDQRVRIASDMLDQMASLGYKVTERNRNRILQAVDQLKDLKGIESKLEESQPDYERDLEVPDQNNKEFMEAMGHGLKDWGEVSFEHDPKDTASAHMKMFIGVLPDMDRGIYKFKDSPESITDLPSLSALKADPRLLKQTADRVNRKDFWAGENSQAIADLLNKAHPLLPKKNFLGLTKIADFESTFQEILENLSDSSTHDYETYINKLRSTGRPNLINLIDALDKADQQIKNEFARLVSTQYTNFNMMLFNRFTEADGSESLSLRPILSNRYSQRNNIIKNWKEQQKLAEIMRINEAGDRVIDVARAKDKWLPALKVLKDVDWSKENTPEQQKAKKFVQDVLRISGVDLNDDMINDLFKKMEFWTKGTSVAGGISKQFSITGDGKPNGMFSAFIMKMAGISATADVSNADNISDLESRAELNNPLYTESTTMNILSKVAAAHTAVLHSGSSKNSEGKDIWNYTMHTKLSHMMIDMKENFDEFANRYREVDISKDNYLLNVLSKQPFYRDKVHLEYLDGIKPIWGKRGTTRSDMSDREQLLMSLAFFQNQGSPSSHFFSLTHSDKTMTPLFKNIPRFDVGTAESTPKEVVGEIGSIFYNIFKGEHDRIINQEAQDFNDARYNKGKSLFYFMPEFNKEAMRKMVTDGFLTDREFNTIWMNGDTLTRAITLKNELPIINKILNKVIEDRISTTLEMWKKNGITTEEGNLFDKKYLSKLWDKHGITREKTNEDKMLGRPGSIIKRNGVQLTKQEANDIAVRGAAKDYALNYFVHDISMSQLFYGDPALTFKGGKTDLESVDLTLKEYGKRLAKDIAPGLDPYFRPEDRKFNSITLADHNQTEKYLDNLGKIAPDYKKVNATDAQEFTTVAEHLKVAYANGTINSKVFDDMMKIVNDAKGKYYEFTTPEHLAVIMQPVKPVYTNQRPAENGAILEDYIKTSSIPLYPPATQGLELDGLRTTMEKQGLDRAPFESGRKIGSPSKPAQFFDANGRFKIPSIDEINGATRQLDRNGFRIQQEVPYDETKEAIKTVSQMNKLITEGISELSDFKVGNESYSGQQIREMKENIRKKMIGFQLNDFFKSWGVDQGRIQDKSLVYDKLISLSGTDKLTQNELQSLLGRDKDGNLWIPLQYNTSVDNLESMMMSMIKDISQVKMPGKSFVQASSVGWTFKSEGGLDKSGIVWSDTYDGSPLKTTRVEDGVVKPAQVIVPFNFIDKNGVSRKVEDYTIVRDGKKVIDTTKVPKELTEMIGARIPNQGHSSMAAMEVVGFLPKNMGDTIIVPAAFTKQMGADFDVDKLYTYRRPYYHKVEENTFHQDRTPNSMEQHQSDYFNVHWSVLTHPEMAERILKPLDKPDIKAENELLQGAKSDSYNYFDHMNQLQDFQNGKDAKMLVALTSLSVVFNSVIQDKELHVMKEVPETTPEGKVIYNKVRETIPVKDEHTGKTLELTNLSGNGKSTYTKMDAGPILDDSTRTKSDNHSTIQSAAVDNAKDRSLDNLNITPDTYPAIDALNQLETEDGEAVNLKYGTRLLTQPIIKEFASEMKKGNDSLSTTYNSALKESVIEKLRSSYMGEHDPKEIEEAAQEVLFDPQLLLKAQKMEEGSKDYVVHQIAALNLFEKLDQIGKRLSELRSYFNQDTKGAGKNLLTALDKSDKLIKLDQAPIANASQIFSDPKTKIVTEQGFTAQATTGVAVNVLTQILPYDKYTPLFSELTAHSGKDTMSLDQQRDVLRAVRSFTYNSGEHWWRDATNERGRLFYSKDESLSLARRVEQAKRTWGKDNYFLQRLDPVIGDTKFSPDFLEYQAVTVGRIDESNNNRAWTELLMSKDKEQRELGEDLLRYAYLTGGVQDQNSFVKFVPNAYISNTEFGNMLKTKGEAYQGPSSELNNVNKDIPGFIPQYIQHYPERAFNIDRNVFGELPAEQNYPESFRIDPFNLTENQKTLYTPDGLPRQFVSYRSPSESKWILYQSQLMNTGDIYFTRIDTLGNQYTDEYNGEQDGIIRSIFTENRSMAELIPSPATVDRPTPSVNRDIQNQKVPRILDELGIAERQGPTAFEPALTMIAAHDHVDESLRTVAKLLLDNPMPEFVDTANHLFGIDYKPELVVNPNSSTQATSWAKGTISLNPNKISNVNEGAEAFLHEMIHQRLQAVVVLGGYDERYNNHPHAGERARLREDMKSFEQKHPEAIKHLQELDRIRYEAYSKLRTELGEGIDQTIKDKILAGKALNSREALVYGMRDMQEFVAHVMTDKGVQEYLNQIRTSKGNALQRIWKTFADIISAIGKNLGKWVNKDSLLHEALYHTVSLTTGELYKYDNISNALVNRESLRVTNEAHAENTKQLLEETYNREVQIKKDGLGYTISNDKMKKATNAGTPIGKVAKRINEQIKKAYRDISKGTLEERIQARVRYNELKQQKEDLLRENNLSRLQEIAESQLTWINKVMDNPKANATQVQAAIDASSIWGEVMNIMYGGTKNAPRLADPTFSRIEEQANLYRIKLINENAAHIVTQALSPRTSLSDADFAPEDIPGAQAYFLTLSRVKPKLLSGIGAITREAANNRDEHMSRIHNQLLDIRQRMSKLNISADKFMQKDSWGLLDRLSNNWHEHLATLNDKRDGQLEALAKMEGLNDKVLQDRKAQVWQSYWKEIRKVGAFVDTRLFFDTVSGKRLPNTDKHFNDLVSKVGNQEYAKELLDQAHEKYQKYVQERKIQADYLDSQIQLSEAEKQGKTAVEQEKLRKDAVAKELDRWLHWNSPSEFLNRMTGKGELKYVNEGSRWVIMAPKGDQKHFYDDRFTELMKDEKVKPIFNEYKALIQEMSGYLPPEHSEKLPPGFFPIVSHETILGLNSMIQKLKNWDVTLLNKLTATESEEEWRAGKPDEIPVSYTRPTFQTKEIADRSTDLIRVAEVFSMMALHYKYMAPILDQVNLAESIVKEANRQRISGNSEGDPLRNAMDVIKYNKDKLIFNKPNELEGKIDNPIYSIKPWEQVKIQKKIKDLTEEKKALQDKMLEKMENGEWDNEEELDKIAKIDEQLTEYEKSARFIYASKVTDTLISINQIKALGFNPFSAVTNFTFAAVSNHVYATGRTDFDPSHLRQAMGIAMHAMKNYYTFGAGMDATARKIRSLMERSQVMTELTGTDHLATRDKSHLKEALSPYNWQKSGDYYAKGSMMIAMMLKHQVEVVDKVTGEKSKVRLWDALDENGKWDTSKYHENKEWYNEDVAQQKEWNKFRDRMRGVATIVFGNQDKNSPLLAKKFMLWRLVGQFRMSWFPEGLNARFGSERFDPMLGRDVKGRYRSFGTLGLFTSFNIMARSVLDAIPGIHVDRFKGLTDKKGEAIKDVDMENMRRNFTGMAWTISLTASILLLRALYDETHKGKKKTSSDMQRQLLINMLIRSQQDLTMYSTPSVWDTVTGNIIPATTVVTDAMKALKATGHYMFGDTHKDKHAFRTWALKITKATPILNNINKAEYMFNRDLDSIQR